MESNIIIFNSPIRYSIAIYNNGKSMIFFDIDFNLLYSTNLTYACKDIIFANNLNFFIMLSDSHVYIYNCFNFEYEIFTNFTGIINVRDMLLIKR